MTTPYFLQDAQGAYHPINGPTMIGRDLTCQIKLYDPEVSRNHALLWMERQVLYLRDENTKNGTFIDEWRIPPEKPIALSAGSQVRVGKTVFTVVSLQPVPVQPPVAAPAPAHSNRLLVVLGLLFGGFCLCALILMVGFLLIRSRTTQATSPDFPGMTVVATSQPRQPLTPQEFADANDYLALSVARLNTAELVFIRQAGADNPAPQTLDQALCEVAAQAMNVALLAEKQGYNAATQGGSSAEQYYSIARLGYALVLESQNLRQGLQKQAVTPARASQTMARYGLRLWNPQVSEPGAAGNPFARYAADVAAQPSRFLSSASVMQLNKQLDPGTQIQTWLATSDKVETINIDLPALGQPLAQPFDPTLLQNLTQASGQADADQARQAATEKLALLLPYSEQVSIAGIPFSMHVMVLSGAAIADGSQIEAGKVPTFAKGRASALAKQAASAGNEFAENVFTLAGEAPPVQTESTPVKETQPVVTLQITGAKETSRTPMAKSFGDLIQFEVQISWQSTLSAPMLDLGCLGGSSVRVTGQSGSVKVSAAAYANPQTQQATISCRASRPADFVQSLSETSMQVSVNSPANVELVPPPPTVTETLPPTVTQTLEPSETPTPNIALSTEVAAQKTAEFQGTITAIAAQTEQANQAGTFTLNGTFGLSHPDDPCNLGPYSSGTLQITVNFGTGAANGTLTGGGSSTRSGLVCGAMKFDVTCNSSYTGSFSGGVDKTSGALSMAGNVSGSQSCTFTNCSQDGVEFPCTPGSSTIADPLTVTGTVIQSSGTGNGALQTCAGCSGDWSAGK